MALIAAWDAFVGCNQLVHPKRLKPGLGVIAANILRGSADFRPLPAATTVVTTGGATPILSAWRMGRSTPSDTDNWLQWTVDVDVVRTLIANDTAEEIHYTGDGAPKTTDTALALPGAPGPASARTLGIPKPPTAMGTPTVLAAGSSTTNESRVYVDTFVNDKGRESAPGVPVAVTVVSSATMTLPSLSAVPSGNHGITLRRIYVSVDGGDYMRCVEQAATTTTATDSGTRGAILQSGGDTSKPAWLEPPTDLKGLIGLWNGMIGGHVGKAYTVCEPGKAWAWPVEYQEVVPDDIVGSGRYQQNWVILTTERPYIVRGTGPLNMGNEPVPMRQSCVAKRSICSIDHGVVWASPAGLCYVGTLGAQNLTEDIFSPDQWQALAPTTMVTAAWNRYVLVFFSNGGAYKGFMIDPRNLTAGIIWLSQGAKGTFYDPISSRLYLLDTGNTIKRWAAGSAQSATWKSPQVRAKDPVNAGAGMVIADEPVSCQFTLWANKLQASGAYSWEQVFDRTVQTNLPFALPSGYVAHDYQAQITTTAPVQAVTIAEDFDELP